MAEKLLTKLQLPKEEVEDILLLFPRFRESLNALRKTTHWEVLSADTFAMVADWHHFAILSLLETKGAKLDNDWIAKKLGLKKEVIHIAIERMKNLGLLQAGPSPEQFHLTGAQFISPDQVSNLAVRQATAQQLELAKASLQNDPIEKRDFATVTMAIDPAKIPDARRMVREFRDRLCAYLESGEKKEVYTLAIQLYPLSKEIS